MLRTRKEANGMPRKVKDNWPNKRRVKAKQSDYLAKSHISAFETTTPHLSTSEKRQLQLANGYPTKLGLRFGGPLDPDSARDFAIYPQ
jgi:hypothetical protein